MVELAARPDPSAVTLTEFLATQNNATSVRINPGDNVRLLVAHLDRIALIEIAFPTFRDGRGYSSARIVREAGYKGELRAAGDVLVDQLAYMRRCGFDSFAPDKPLDPVAAQAAIDRYPFAYQFAADARVAIWKLRNG